MIAASSPSTDRSVLSGKLWTWMSMAPARNRFGSSALEPRNINPPPPPEQYLTANTQTAPPSGTSGNLPGDIRFKRDCIVRESIPQPDCTATYCLPSTMNDDGWPMMPELVGNSHSSAPLDASNARNRRSWCRR